MTDDVNKKIDHALQLARHGLPIIPLWGVRRSSSELVDCRTGEATTKASGKIPKGPWQDLKTVDESQILRWFEEDPDMSYGVCMGNGWLVVDCDTEDASDRFEEALETILDDDGEPVEVKSYVVRTGRGYHYYFRGHTRNRVAAAEGLDIRGDGGYVVGPGCLSWNGGEYRWLSGSLDEVDEIPSWLLKGDERERDREALAAGGSSEAYRFGEGLRNDALFQIMSSMVGHGIDKDTVESAIRHVNLTQVDPPLTDDELEHTLFKTLRKPDFLYGGAIQTLVALRDYEWNSHLYREQDGVLESREFMLDTDFKLMPRPTWIVPDRIPNRGVMQMHGRSYTGKTFVAIDMALSFCNGLPWLGMEWRRDTTRDGELKDHCLYVLTEGLFDFGQRVEGWCRRKGGDARRLITLAERPYDLAKREEWDRLWTAMEQDERVRKVAHRVGMVVVDTQSNAIVANESDNNEMARVASTLRLASTRMECPILLVHHDPYGDPGPRGGRIGGRGASSFGAAMDVVMALDPPAPRSRVLSLTFTKVKAARAPEHPLSFFLCEQDVDGATTAVADDEGVNELMGGENLVLRVREILLQADRHTLRWGEVYAQLGFAATDPRVRQLRDQLASMPEFRVEQGRGRGNYYEIELLQPRV